MVLEVVIVLLNALRVCTVESRIGVRMLVSKMLVETLRMLISGREVQMHAGTLRELAEAVIIFVEAVRVLIKDARGRGSSNIGNEIVLDAIRERVVEALNLPKKAVLRA
jgi:hypothetical protein